MSAAKSPFGRTLERTMLASVSEADCLADPRIAFETMLAVGRAMLSVRQQCVGNDGQLTDSSAQPSVLSKDGGACGVEGGPVDSEEGPISRGSGG